MGVAHVVHAKDHNVLVLRYAFSDVLKEAVLVFAGLLGDLGHVHDLAAF